MPYIFYLLVFSLFCGISTFFTGCHSSPENLCFTTQEMALVIQKKHLLSHDPQYAYLQSNLDMPKVLVAFQRLVKQYNLSLEYQKKLTQLHAEDQQSASLFLNLCSEAIEKFSEKKFKTEKSKTSDEKKQFLKQFIGHYFRQFDPHTSILDEKQIIKSESSRDDFGLKVSRSVGPKGKVFVTIDDVHAGGPASFAGLKESMQIYRINQVEVARLAPEFLYSLIEAKLSSEIVIEAFGPTGFGLKSYFLKKTKYDLAPIKWATYPIGTQYLGYIKLRNFVSAGGAFSEALKSLEMATALILDLRDMAGGEVSLAMKIADPLIGNQAPFVGLLNEPVDQNKKSPAPLPASRIETLYLKPLPAIWKKPIVVLVNSSTKSAAEILAGALQDYGAVVVGSRTFGKGTRQSQYAFHSLAGQSRAASDQLEIKKDDSKDLPGAKFDFFQGWIEITDAFTVRPSGRLIQGQGIIPDYELSDEESCARKENDYPMVLRAPLSVFRLEGFIPNEVDHRRKTLGAWMQKHSSQDVLSVFEMGVLAAQFLIQNQTTR